MPRKIAEEFSNTGIIVINQPFTVKSLTFADPVRYAPRIAPLYARSAYKPVTPTARETLFIPLHSGLPYSISPVPAFPRPKPAQKAGNRASLRLQLFTTFHSSATPASSPPALQKNPG